MIKISSYLQAKMLLELAQYKSASAAKASTGQSLRLSG